MEAAGLELAAAGLATREVVRVEAVRENHDTLGREEVVLREEPRAQRLRAHEDAIRAPEHHALGRGLERLSPGVPDVGLPATHAVSPRVAKVGDPRPAERRRHQSTEQVDRVGRRAREERVDTLPSGDEQAVEKRPREPRDLGVGDKSVAVDCVPQRAERSLRSRPLAATLRGAAVGTTSKGPRQALLEPLELEGRRPVHPDTARELGEELRVPARPVWVARRLHDRLPAEVAQVLRELQHPLRAASALRREAIRDHEELSAIRLHRWLH